jgi:hypothetical protein
MRIRPAAAILLVPALLLQACCERAPEGATVLRAARIYAAPDEAPIDDGAVLMKDGRILAVGPEDSIATRGAAELAACDDGVVTAGFQNSHVHFTEAKFSDAGNRPAGELAAALEAMLTRYGFTTVLDTASDVDNTVALRARIESGDVAGPRILTAGWALFPANGIPFYLRGMPAEFLSRLPQPATVEEALASVQSNLNRGADATKLFVMTPLPEGRVAFMEPDIALAAAVAARASLFRTESRWGLYHHRLDFPEMDNRRWFTHVNLRKRSDGEMEALRRPVAPYVVPLDDDELGSYHRLRIADAVGDVGSEAT